MTYPKPYKQLQGQLQTNSNNNSPILLQSLTISTATQLIMSETPNIHETSEMAATILSQQLETPDLHDVPDQLIKAKKAYKEYAKGGDEDPPTQLELFGWYMYGLCSYFVQTVLLPVLFPLIIAQISSSDLPHSPPYTSRGIACKQQEIDLYQKLVHRSIRVRSCHLSPLHWTAISWAAGALLSIPLLVYSSRRLNRGRDHSLLLGGAAAGGGFVCLQTGFFRIPTLFPLFVVAVVAASAVGSAAHTRHLALMSRAHPAPPYRSSSSACRLSLYGTAAGCVAAAVITLFTYHMVRRSDSLTGLWVVSIFSGLKWFAGISHAFLSANRPAPTAAKTWAPEPPPRAAVSTAASFLSSFSSACLFVAATLHAVGGLCVRPVIVLAVWVVYFASPAVSLPLLRAAQLALHADAVRMQLLGLFASAAAAGAGFYFADRRWRRASLMCAAVVQGTAAGVLHAFSRVLLVGGAPAGREGTFAAWHAWAMAAGAGAGFAVASAYPEGVRTTFGASFCAVAVGILVLVFGNGGEAGEAAEGAAGDEEEEEKEAEKASPVMGVVGMGEGRGRGKGDGGVQV